MVERASQNERDGSPGNTELDDAFKSEIKDVVLEQCATFVFLPNSKAATSARGYYAQCELSDTHIQQIANGVKKRDYFISNGYGFRRIDLSLKKVALTFLGELTSEERELLNRMMSDNPESWQADWLMYRGLPEWADHYRSYLAEMKEEVQFACA